MTRVYRRLESLDDLARDFIEEARETHSPAWAKCVQSRIARFEDARERNGWTHEQAFARVSTIFDDVSALSLEQARVVTNAFRRWLIEGGHLESDAPAIVTTKGKRRARCAPAPVDFAPVLMRLDDLAVRLERIERQAPELAQIVKSLDLSREAAPAPQPQQVRNYEHDVPLAFARVQLERVVANLGAEAAADALGCNLGTLTRALSKPGAMPRLDTDRLDEVYVGVRAIALDLDASDLLDDLQRLVRARRARTLDDIAEHQAPA